MSLFLPWSGKKIWSGPWTTSADNNTRYSPSKSITGCINFIKRAGLWTDFWQLDDIFEPPGRNEPLYGKRTVGFFSLASHALRACEACAIRAHKTLTPRVTDFFTDFEEKTDCFAVYCVVCWPALKGIWRQKNYGYSIIKDVEFEWPLSQNKKTWRRRATAEDLMLPFLRKELSYGKEL